MQLVAEGGSDEDGDGKSGPVTDNLQYNSLILQCLDPCFPPFPKDISEDLRQGAVEDFLLLIDKGKLPAILAQTISWVLGEYSYLSVSHENESVMLKLVDLAYQTPDATTRASVISALLKLVAQAGGETPDEVVTLVQEYSVSTSVDVQQR